MGTFEGVIVHGVHLKWHNFGRWESFQGLVDMPRMCLLCVSFAEGYGLAAISPRKTQILAIAAIDYTAYDVTRCVSYLLPRDETKAGSIEDIRSKQSSRIVEFNLH